MCTLTSESDIFRGLGGEVQFAVQAPGFESDPSHPSSGLTDNSISEWERFLGDLKIWSRATLFGLLCSALLGFRFPSTANNKRSSIA